MVCSGAGALGVSDFIGDVLRLSELAERVERERETASPRGT